MRNTFARCLLQKMEDEETYLFTGDLGFSVFEPIREKHPEYFMNMGVAEQNMLGVAAGMAHMGKKVYTYSIIPFLAYRAFEQIRDDICYPSLPVRMVGVGAGMAYADAGPTHHAYEDTTIMGTLPGLTLLHPSDPYEVEAFMGDMDVINGPVYMRLSRNGEPMLHKPGQKIEIGKAVKLVEGDDLLFVSTGAITRTAVEVVGRLNKEGISTELLEIHTLKPFDSKALRKEIEGKKAVVTLEESKGTLQSLVSMELAQMEGHARVIPFALPDGFAHVSGTRDYLLSRFGLDADSVYRGIKGSLNGHR